MARRSNISAAAAIALLVIAQVAFAYVVPEMVVMRVKRNPEPMRSFSFSGFNPSGQMAAFTGMAEYPMFSNYGPPSQAGPYHYSPEQAQGSYGLPHTQDSYGPSSQVPQDSYGPAPSGADQQVAADPNKPKQQSVGQQQPSQENGLKPSVAESNEENNNSVERVENKKQYKGRDGPSSNAEASFNAWFPIMFGVFPNGAGGSGNNNSQSGNRGNNNNNQGQGQDQGYSNGGNGFERSSGGTTVIANSVSNGRHGVATSHAIAYGNPRSSSQK